MPLLIFPLSLLSAFVVTLTPEISRLSGRENQVKLQRAITRILHFTFLIAIFIVAVLMTFSYELGMTIYHSEQVGEMLRLLSWLCPFMCVEMVVVSILQGLGEQVSSLWYNVTDCLLRVALVYVLIPKMGVNGFLIMVIISNLYTSILNLRRLLRITSLRLRLNDWVFKPVLAAAAATQLARLAGNYQIFSTLPVWIALGLGSLLMAGAYTAVLFSVGSVTLKDFSWIAHRLRHTMKPGPVVPEKVL